MTDQKLKNLGFSDADGTVYPRLIIDLAGLEKQGKTHFALTAPGEIAIFNTDIGLEGVVHKFTNEKKIHVYDFTVPYELSSAKKEWYKLVEAWDGALGNSKIRTIIVDTCTDLWDMHKIANFGKLTPGGMDVQYKWGPVNREFQALLKKVYDSKTTNLILLHQKKKKYIKEPGETQGSWNGDYERSGFSKMGYIVQINAEVYRDVNKEFHITITDCRQNPDMAGDDYFGPMVSFPFIAQMALPETSAEDWE